MNDQIQEKTSTSGNEWGPFVFTYSDNITYPIFHLKFTYKSTLNARILIRRRTLKYFGCLPYDESADGEGVLNIFDSFKRNLFPADVQIIVGDEKIPAHSAIVAAASPALAAILESKQCETVQVEDAEKSKFNDHVKVVRVDDVDCEASRNLVSYMYTGEIQILFGLDHSMMKKKLDDALLITTKFQMEDVKDFAFEEIIIKDHICAENVVDILVLGHLHSTRWLFVSALELITKIRREIVKTLAWEQLMEHYPYLYFDVVHRVVVGDRKRPRPW
jgi:hypothetical protein